MGTMNKQEEQDPSFTYRTQTEVHTGNELEPGACANEVCEPEEQTLTSPRQCTRHKLQMNASNCQQPKISKHIAHQLESNTTTNLIKQITFSLSFLKHLFQISFSIKIS